MRKDVQLVSMGGCPLGERSDGTEDIRSTNCSGTIMGEFARS